MSGKEFEQYIANIFEALGYVTHGIGGTGDQGVDLLLWKAGVLIAVQCKNYNQPVGNKAVQEVFSGAKHHKAQQAWVIAPAGFTRGAIALAHSTAVELFARKAIENWLKQAESFQTVRSLQKDLDREDYRTFLNLYTQLLDNLERRYDAEQRCSSEIAYNTEFCVRYEQARHTLYGYIVRLKRDLDDLEIRNPEFTTGEFAALRAEMKECEREIEQWASEYGFFVPPIDDVKEPLEAPSHTYTPPAKASPLPSTASKSASATQNPIVGDTVTIEEGARVTVHSCLSPVSPNSNKQLAPDFEFSAIEVEGCAGPNQENFHFSSANFYLQMADNTRFKVDYFSDTKFPVLHSSRLLPGDCVRGWCTFQTPKGERPIFVIYQHNQSIARWAIPEHR